MFLFVKDIVITETAKMADAADSMSGNDIERVQMENRKDFRYFRRNIASLRH
jgi:hypothetical protein